MHGGCEGTVQQNTSTKCEEIVGMSWNDVKKDAIRHSTKSFKDPVLPASAAVNSTICPCVMPRHDVQHSGNIQCETHVRQELLPHDDSDGRSVVASVE